MAGINTATQIAYILPTEFFAACDTTFEQPNVAKATFRKIPGPKAAGQNVILNKFARWTAYEFTPGTAVDQNVQFSLSKVTITPKHVAIHTAIDDWAAFISTENLDAFAGQLMGDSINRFEDIDCLSLFSSASVSIGSSGTPRIGHLDEAEAYIDGNANEPVGGRKIAAMHSYQARVLAQDLQGLNADGSLVGAGATYGRGDGDLRDKVLQESMVKRLVGMDVLKANNLTISSGLASGCVYVDKKTFVHVPWQGVTMKTQENIKFLNTDMVTFVRYGRAQHLTYGAVKLAWTATTTVS